MQAKRELGKKMPRNTGEKERINNFYENFTSETIPST